MTRPMVEEMYRIMAIANYEERFVIPTTHRETAEDAYELRGGCGFTFGNGCAAGGLTGGAPGGGPAHPYAAFQPAAGGIPGRSPSGIPEGPDMNTFRVLSALLTYPTPDLVSALPEMKEILSQEGFLEQADLDGLGGLFADLSSWTSTTSRPGTSSSSTSTAPCSLHLFEHVHGESRDRGQAMVSLLERYREIGLELSAVELPDFLPVYLEYLSQLPLADARAELAEPVAVITTLARRLQKRCSPYAAVLSALEHLAQAEPKQADLEELAVEEAEDAASRQALDAEWQEEPVDFSRREASFTGRQRARAQGAAMRKEQ